MVRLTAEQFILSLKNMLHNIDPDLHDSHFSGDKGRPNYKLNKEDIAFVYWWWSRYCLENLQVSLYNQMLEDEAFN